VTRSGFQKLAMTRLADARVLLRNHRSSAAYYLAGYAIECALKACIAKKMRRSDIPRKELVIDSYTHRFDRLISGAALTQVITERERTDPRFKEALSQVLKWSSESRYASASPQDALDLLNAIENPQYGVLPCLRTFW
jgi:hypothetical protein